MRRWLLLMMVLLLPLRGWVGEAMAGQMVQQHLHASAAALPDAGSSARAHGHDCDQHAQAAAQPQDDAAPASATASDCPTCASCQACSSVGLSPSAGTPAAMGFSQPPPQAVQSRYASAEAALAFKPPRG